jgi:hypothetical protein
MRRLYYANGSFLTGDAIAAAVLDYADALTKTNGSDIVEFPIVLDSGAHSIVSFLIGPASQIASADEVSSFEEPIDATFLDQVEKKSLSVGARKPIFHERESGVPLDDFE